MWRAFFLALGINLLILGGECLIVEQVVLSSSKSKQSADTMNSNSVFAPASYSQNDVTLNGTNNNRTFKPKDWMPWSLMAAGAIIVIYTYSLPRRQ